MAIDYKTAGVDVEAGYDAVKQMLPHIRATHNERVLSGIGSFSGLFSVADMGMEEPVLVSGTDGVGTKLKLAFSLDMHDTIGIDCVAMCVNDIICQGARPLFFLDYMATGHLVPEKAAQVVAGIAEGCKQAGAALIGGETAEMPGFYADGEYDLAGFAVGIVDRKNIIDPSRVKQGDVLVGLASSGVHSNGFSLVRKVIGDSKQALSKPMPGGAQTVGEVLLAPTRIYVKGVMALLSACGVHGLAHITGGGFIENIPRMLPEGLSARINKGSWDIPPVFGLLISEAGLAEQAAYNTFNMGIGMVAAVAEEDADKALSALKSAGEDAVVIGQVVPGKEGVVFSE